MKFAIIENEFGVVGVDEKILSNTVDEEIIKVLNGCLCCTALWYTLCGDLVEAIKRLHKSGDKFGNSASLVLNLVSAQSQYILTFPLFLK